MGLVRYGVWLRQRVVAGCTVQGCGLETPCSAEAASLRTLNLTRTKMIVIAFARSEHPLTTTMIILLFCTPRAWMDGEPTILNYKP